jgi:hypothetical protein
MMESYIRLGLALYRTRVTLPCLRNQKRSDIHSVLLYFSRVGGKKPRRSIGDVDEDLQRARASGERCCPRLLCRNRITT